MPYRTAWVGLLLATVAAGGWCLSVGLSLPATVLNLVLMFICFFGITKYAATTGFTFLAPAGGKGASILNSLGGTASHSPATLTMGAMINRYTFLGSPIRVTAIPSIPHIFRMLGDHLRRHPLVWGMAPLAYVVGFGFAAGVYIYRCYMEGGLNGLLVTWDMEGLAGQVLFIEGSEVTFFDPQKVAVWMVGGLEAGVLTALRARFAWWPFHPAALVFPARQYGFCLLLVWLVKVTVIRFGGAGLYRRSLPFWYGVIVGYLFGIGLDSVVDAIWFPDAGHFVHGW